jgi:hypothetical protein
VEFVKRRSVKYAKFRQYDGIIAGHTHFSDDEWIDDVHYLNTGCWVDWPCTYVRIKKDQIRLYLWDESAISDDPHLLSLEDHSPPGQNRSKPSAAAAILDLLPAATGTAVVPADACAGL